MATDSPVAGRVAGVAAALSAAGILLQPVAAYAGHGDNATSLLERDNNQQDVDTYMLSNAGQIACSHGKSEMDRTEITASAGGSDIHCYDANYGATGWTGQTECTDTSYLPYLCDQFSVRFNYYYWGTNPTEIETPWWKSTGCHEFGHTTSVGHRFPADDGAPYSCMRNGSSSDTTTFDQHDIETIDSQD